MQLHLGLNIWYLERELSWLYPRSQEHPLSFLRGHRGDSGLPDKLGSWFFICDFIWVQLDDIWWEQIWPQPRSQEHPLSFLRWHVGYSGLHYKLGSWLLVCDFIWSECLVRAWLYVATCGGGGAGSGGRGILETCQYLNLCLMPALSANTDYDWTRGSTQ